MDKLSDNIERKFKESFDIDNYEIWTDEGWKDLNSIHKTIKYDVWKLTLVNGIELECADNHIVFLWNDEEIFVKNLKPGVLIKTEEGNIEVKSVKKLNRSENMYDVSVEGSKYYSNGILSHNTTMIGAYALWYAIFHDDKQIGIVSNKAESAKDVLDRIRIMYEELPTWLKPGVKQYAVKSVIFENNSKVFISSTSKSAFRGRTLNCITGDARICIVNDNNDIFYTTIKKATSSNINILDGVNIMNLNTEKKYYTVYKLTNLINDMIYIGFHSTNDLDDGYMGSGKYIKRAIEKYKPENFKKEYLAIYDNKDEAEKLERELVNEEFIKRKDTYNLSIGGNVCILFGENNGFYGKKHSKETIERIREKSKNYKHTDSAKQKISKKIRKIWKDEKFKKRMSKLRKNHFVSEETKKKISESNKGKIKSIEHKRKLSESKKEFFKNLNEEQYNKWYSKTFTEERNKKLSNSLKGRKLSEEHINKVNRNPEKIRKTAEKHRGMKRSEETKIRISEACKGRKANNKGRVYCYNPITREKGLYKKEEVPDGWKRGFLPKCKS